MKPFDVTEFVHLLRKKVDQELQILKDRVTASINPQDSYIHTVGRVGAYKDVKRWIDEIFIEVNKEDDE